MKEAYFTSRNIAARSRKILSLLKGNAGPRRIDFRTGRAALLVIDMQRYFLDKDSRAFLPSAPPIVRNIQKLIKAFSRAGLTVIFTRHINNTKNAGMLAGWWDDLITEENPLNEIVPELEHARAKVFKKSQYDAFHRTGLEAYLKKHRIDTLAVTGVMTHLCCETTARSAFVRGFNVYFVVDGTATQNLDFHCATLLNLAHGFAMPVLTDELVKNLNDRDADASKRA
jgi:isochorismate hydrolase